MPLFNRLDRLDRRVVPRVPPGVRKVFGRIPPQIGLVVLQADHIVGLFVDELFRDLLLTAHGIRRDDAVFNVQHLQKRGDRRDLVGFLLHSILPQYQLLPIGPRAHHMDGALFPATAPLEGFSVYADDLTLFLSTDRGHPLAETAFKLGRIDHTPDPLHRIMGRKPVCQLQMQRFFEPCFFYTAKIYDIFPYIAAGNDRVNRHNHDFQKIVLHLPRLSQICKLCKIVHMLFARSRLFYYFYIADGNFFSCVGRAG